MKTMIAILAFIVLVVVGCANETPSQVQEMRSPAMADGTILASSDGGVNWYVVQPPKLDKSSGCYDICACSMTEKGSSSGNGDCMQSGQRISCKDYCGSLGR